MRKRLPAFIVIAALGLFIYSGVLNAPFVFDDHLNIETNLKVRSLANFLDLSGARYVAYLSFALNYALGGLDTFGYHLFNVIIHVSNAILLYLLISLVLKAVRENRRMDGDRGTLPGDIAFAASLIFLTHPLQTQAVAYVTQRFASLAAFFYLLSLVLYVKARLTGGGAWRAWAVYAASLLSAVAAQKTKEISFTLPVVVALFELSMHEDWAGFRKRLPSLVPFLLCLLIIPITLFASGAAGRGADTALKAAQLEDLRGLSVHDYLVTQFAVAVTYLRLLILPTGQNVDYDYPLYGSIAAPRVLFSLALIIALFSSAVCLYLKSRDRKDPALRLISFGAFFFFITLSVESSVIPIKDVIFEHRVYLPSAGLITAFCSALFYGADRLRWKHSRRGVWVVVALIVAASSIATMRRNTVWTDELTLWRDSARKAPGNPRALNNIGYILAHSGRAVEAIAYLNRALEIRPEYPDAYNNLAYAFTMTGDFDRAAQSYRKALTLNPGYWQAYNNLGNLLLDSNRPQEAQGYFREALRINPGSPEAYNNLGYALFLTGDIDGAIGHYGRALGIDPEYSVARANLNEALDLKAGSSQAQRPAGAWASR
ncbi:MAG: tetratricopeptide repeat protein [Deltaproteobacteria bacterium]|nr:tetratricopeptide repeat protein [Deltaproteobacteria bacterium]